jgi:hypothetical protein
MANKSKNNKQAPAKQASKPSTPKPQASATNQATQTAEKKTRVVRSARERLADAPGEILKKLESVGAYLAKCQSPQARHASEIAKNARATMADLRDAIKIIPADDAPNASRDYVVGDVVKLTAARDLSGEGHDLDQRHHGDHRRGQHQRAGEDADHQRRARRSQRDLQSDGDADGGHPGDQRRRSGQRHGHHHRRRSHPEPVDQQHQRQ